MRTPRLFGRREEGGQALVILAVSLTAVLSMTALIIDGGNAMAQQRATQNSADAAALAGATVMVEKMGGGSKSDGDVSAAVQSAFRINASDFDGAVYVDYNNSVVGTVGQGGSIPTTAGGVRVTGSRTFSTFLASMAGLGSMDSGAEATALAGARQGGACAPHEACAVMPVTFSIPVQTCDGTNRPLQIGRSWPLVSLEDALADSDGSDMSIVPLCKTGPGGVGWLDMSKPPVNCPGTNLGDWVSNPCTETFDLPVWLPTQSGNVNALESALNSYRGKVLLIPMFDSTCREVPSSGLPAHCTDPGNGDKLWYHIPQFAAFLLHQAHVSGGDGSACSSPPGQPTGGGNGATSCVKGWFVKFITVGPVGPPRDCTHDPNPQACAEQQVLSTQLVR